VPPTRVQDICEGVPGGALVDGECAACLPLRNVEVEGMGIGVESGEDSRKEHVIHGEQLGISEGV
jgi:hypothetical protein